MKYLIKWVVWLIHDRVFHPVVNYNQNRSTFKKRHEHRINGWISKCFSTRFYESGTLFFFVCLEMPESIPQTSHEILSKSLTILAQVVFKMPSWKLTSKGCWHCRWGVSLLSHYNGPRLSLLIPLAPLKWLYTVLQWKQQHGPLPYHTLHHI